MTSFMATGQQIPTPFHWRVTAFVVVIFATIGVRIIRLHLIRSLMHRVCDPTVPEATSRQAETALAAIDAISPYVPARVACFERSISAAILIRLRRRTVTWCHGVKIRPVALHAWIEVDGQAIGEVQHVAVTYNVLSTTNRKGRV